MKNNIFFRIKILPSMFLLGVLLCPAEATLRAADNPPTTSAALKTSITVPDLWSRIQKELPKYESNDLPLSEVARNLRKEFNDDFDVLLPIPSPDPMKTLDPMKGIDPNTGLPLRMETVDWQAKPVFLQLKNVTIRDVFNAMNIKFQLNKEPLRWDLIVNGDRPTAVLRVLELAELFPAPPPPAREEKREVFYVGRLLAKNKSAGMSMGEILATLKELDDSSRGDQPPLRISGYEAGDLVVVRGTPEQLNFSRSLLEALQSKLATAEVKSRYSNTPPSQAADSK